MHTEEFRLREACARGDLKAVNRLLNPEVAGCSSSAVGRLLLKQMHVKQRAPSLRCLYTDDSCNFIVHYLAGARLPLSGLAVFYETFASWFRIRLFPNRNDRERAHTIYALLVRNHELDLSLQNAHGQTVLHFCVLSDSIEVLRVILRAVANGKLPPERCPVIGLQDQEGATALSLALEHHSFTAVRLLVAAGAVTQEPHVQNPHSTQNQINSALGQSGSSKSPKLLQSVTSSVSDLLGRKDQKLKDLHAELERNKRQQPNLKTRINVLNTEQEIKQQFDSALELIQSRLNVDQSIAQTIFVDCKFNIQEALNAHPPVLQPVQNTETVDCMVCFDQISAKCKNRIQLACGHVTCDLCWHGVLEARLSEGDVHKTVCPDPDCSLQFPLSSLPLILKPNQIKRFEQLLISRYVDIHNKLKWCPRQKCESVLELQEDFPESQSPCSVSCSCGEEFCWRCSYRSHEPVSCEQAEEWRGALDVVQTEKKSETWMKAETVPCPNCKSPIQRDGGCNQMSCSVCQQQFCYECGKPWRGHTDHYTCTEISRNRLRRIHIPTGMWSVVEGIFKKVKEAVTVSSYEWHLKQYLAHNVDPVQFRRTGEYMTHLLATTLPDEDLSEPWSHNGKKIIIPDLHHISVLVETVLSGENILKNSSILSFYLRKTGSRRK